MLTANRVDRLNAARRALAEASSATGVSLTRGDARTQRPVIATGIAGLDHALGGGLPRGRILEIVGGRSSGRLSLTLALISRALHTGEPAVLIDVADALDPRALHPDDRARLLWVRPNDALTAMKCADLLLDGGGFGLVALYLVGVGRCVQRDLERQRLHAARPRDPAHTVSESVAVIGQRALGSGAWARLAQRAEKARSTVLVALDAKSTHAPGAFAYASMAVSHHRAQWRGRKLLETVQCEVTVRRSKSQAVTGACAEVTFRAG